MQVDTYRAQIAINAAREVAHTLVASRLVGGPYITGSPEVYESNVVYAILGTLIPHFERIVLEIVQLKHLVGELEDLIPDRKVDIIPEERIM